MTIQTAEERERSVAEAAEILRRGGLLAIPTETVYGLGANGLDEAAVRRIFAAKGRPQDNPLILHIPDASWLKRYCENVPEAAYRLAEAFWPGPLTMILPRKACVPDVVTAGLGTVGMRCPDHPVTLEVLRAADVPVAAPSANRSGRPSCTTAAHVLEDMDGRIDAVLDGGPCGVGVESTIIDLTVTPPRLLRPGGLPLEQLRSVLGEVEVDKAVVSRLSEGERPRAPGMKYRHYAPKAPVTVVTGDAEKSARYIARRLSAGTGVLCFDEYAKRFPGAVVRTLGPAADKAAQAHRVFDALRAFDGTSVTEIYAQCPDSAGLGLAVENRLKKAAGFHTVELPPAGKTIVGFTGPTGAGKTSALRALRRLGAHIIDCDRLYAEMLESDIALQNELRRTFGDDIWREGGLDRPALAKRVFRDAEELQKLNAIVFAAVPREVLRRVRAAEESVVGVDAINLLDCLLRDFCDVTVAVTAPEEARLRRIMARDGLSEEAARLRIAAQRPAAYYTERCDHVFINDAATAQEAEERAEELLAKLIGRI
ncbi:MAG: L-threonylcarbamoyladenylate synthase [Oscillospiraceae bacterium]